LFPGLYYTDLSGIFFVSLKSVPNKQIADPA
jgi:hypothetical protein